jgi:phage tail tape-measure protein
VNRRISAIGGISLAAIILVAGCSGQPLTTREKGIGLGALLGAGSGAIVGAAVGHPGAGAAIGGALGAGTGYVVGNEFQNLEIAARHNEARLSYQQREIESQRRQIRQLQETAETE